MSFANVLFIVLIGGAPPQEPQALTVSLTPCAERSEGRGLLEVLLGMPERDQFAFKGELVLDDEKYTIYLPRAKSYGIVNSGKGDDHHHNTSTPVIVDANRNGRTDEAESWFANLPVRLGDRMFAVKSIEPDGSALVLAPSEAPLRGVVLGSSCPPFRYQTQDGKTVSLSDYKNKILILDFWSVT